MAGKTKRGWQAKKKTHLWVASSIRAMPEKEKPPAMRVDIYSPIKKRATVPLPQCEPIMEPISLIGTLSILAKFSFTIPASYSASSGQPEWLIKHLRL